MIVALLIGFVLWLFFGSVYWLVTDAPPLPIPLFTPLSDYRKFRNSTDYVRISNLDGGWKCVDFCNLPIMKFDTFLSLYAIAPKKYDINGRFTVKYNGKENRWDDIVYQAVFTFSYKDWRRYVAWKAKKELDKQKQKAYDSTLFANEALASMLEDVQKDIDAAREKSRRETEKALAENLRVVGCLCNVPMEQVKKFIENWSQEPPTPPTSGSNAKKTTEYSSDESSSSKVRIPSPPVLVEYYEEYT